MPQDQGLAPKKQRPILFFDLDAPRRDESQPFINLQPAQDRIAERAFQPEPTIVGDSSQRPIIDFARARALQGAELLLPPVTLNEPEPMAAPTMAPATRRARPTLQMPGTVAARPLAGSDEDVRLTDSELPAVDQVATNRGSDGPLSAFGLRDSEAVTPRTLRLSSEQGRVLSTADDVTVQRLAKDAFVASHRPDDQDGARFLAQFVPDGFLTDRPKLGFNDDGTYTFEMGEPGWWSRGLAAYKEGGPQAAAKQVAEDAANLDRVEKSRVAARAGTIEEATRLAAAEAEGLSQGREAGGGMLGGIKAAGYGAISGTQDAIAAALSLPNQIKGAFSDEYYNPADDPALARQFREAAARTSAASSGEAVPESGLLRRYAGAAGSMVPFITAGMATGGSSAAIGAFGAAQNASSQQREAIEAGGSPDQIRTAYGLGGVVGAGEALGFKGAGPAGRGLRAGAREIAGEFVEEGLQEGGSQALNNMIASTGAGYDPQRKWYEGVPESALVGAVLGGVSAGSMRGMSSAVERFSPQQVQAVGGFFDRAGIPAQELAKAPVEVQTKAVEVVRAGMTAAQGLQQLAEQTAQQTKLAQQAQLAQLRGHTPSPMQLQAAQQLPVLQQQAAQLQQQVAVSEQELQRIGAELAFESQRKLAEEAARQAKAQPQTATNLTAQPNVDEVGNTPAGLTSQPVTSGTKGETGQNTLLPVDEGFLSGLNRARNQAVINSGEVVPGQSTKQSNAIDEQPDLLGEIRKAGGMSDDDVAGELRRLGGKEGGTTGIARANDKGLSPDRMRGDLKAEGLTKAETVDDFLQEVEDELRYRRFRDVEDQWSDKAWGDHVEQWAEDQAEFEQLTTQLKNNPALEAQVHDAYQEGLTNDEYEQLGEQLESSVGRDDASRILYHLINTGAGFRATRTAASSPETQLDARAARPNADAEDDAGYVGPDEELSPVRSNPIPEWMRGRNIFDMSGAELTQFVLDLRGEKSRMDAAVQSDVNSGVRSTVKEVLDAAVKRRAELKKAGQDVPPLNEPRPSKSGKKFDKREAARKLEEAQGAKDVRTDEVRPAQIVEAQKDDARNVAAKPDNDDQSPARLDDARDVRPSDGDGRGNSQQLERIDERAELSGADGTGSKRSGANDQELVSPDESLPPISRTRPDEIIIAKSARDYRVHLPFGHDGFLRAYRNKLGAFDPKTQTWPVLKNNIEQVADGISWWFGLPVKVEGRDAVWTPSADSPALRSQAESDYPKILRDNKEAVDRLAEINLMSDEAGELLDDIYQYTVVNGIAKRHYDALVRTLMQIHKNEARDADNKDRYELHKAIDEAAANSGALERVSEINQSVRDRVLADAKLFGDGANAQATISQGFKSLDRDAQHVVLSKVVRSINKGKIFKAIIQTVPVDVMDVLMGGQGAAKKLLHDKTVLAHRLTVPRDSPILEPVIRFMDSLASAVGRVATNSGTENARLPLSAVPSAREQLAATVAGQSSALADTATASDRAEKPLGLPAGAFGGSLEADSTSRANQGRRGGSAPPLPGTFASKGTEEAGLSSSPNLAIKGDAAGITNVSSDSRHIHSDVIHGQPIYVDINPTQAQKEAGNYLHGAVKWNGLNLSIENPKGSTRSGVDADGEPWSVTMSAAYGYLKLTEGADGEHLDIYMGDKPESGKVFVIDQNEIPSGKFDEHKVVLGVTTRAEAEKLYDAHFSDSKGPQRRAAVTEMSVDEFKGWLKDGDQTKPLVNENSAQINKAKEAKDLAKNEAGKPDSPQIKLSDDAQAVLKIITKQGALKRNEVNFATMMTNSRSRPAIDELIKAGAIVEADGKLQLPTAKAPSAPDFVKIGDEFEYKGKRHRVTEFRPQADGATWIYTAELNKKGEVTSSIGSWPPDNLRKLIESQKPKASEDAASKEPWQMTLAEYREAVKAGDVPGMERAAQIANQPSNADYLVEEYFKENVDSAHLFAVFDAIEQGKPVPDEVRSAYGYDVAGTLAPVADMSALFDEAIAQREKEEAAKRPASPKMTGTKAKKQAKKAEIASDEQTVKAVAKRAAKEAVGGIDETMKALGKLFGDPRALRSGLAFDEKTYAAAKPHFEAAIEHFGQATKDARAALNMLLDAMLKDGYSLGTLKKMRPFIVRFMEDWQAANVQQSEQTDEAKPVKELKNLTGLGLQVVSYPSGKFGYAGKVPDSIGYVDGATPEQIANGKSFGEKFGPKQRRFDTREDAIKFANDNGYAVAGQEAKGQPDLFAAAEQTGVESAPEVNDGLREDGNDSVAGRESADVSAVGDARDAATIREGSSERSEKSIRAARRERQASTRSARGSDAANVGDSATEAQVSLDARVAEFDQTDETTESQPSSAAKRAPDFVIADDEALYPNGTETKLKANLEALRLLSQLQAESRPATVEEQATLAQYTGWGQFPDVFNEYNEGGKKRAEVRAELKALLGDAGYERARASTLNAHYTDPKIVRSVWEIAHKLGFKGGRVLEPSVGTGNFFGVMPQGLRAKSKLTGVELDPATAAIAAHLYPSANVQAMGFQDLATPDGFFDLVVGNVPFGDYKVNDARYNKHRANIHDYFFLKVADQLREGGVAVLITSTGTMDKLDAKIRTALAAKVNLVAAMRLPGQTFKANAGTDVVTDIIVLRKTVPDARILNNWMETRLTRGVDGTEHQINEYFADNPAQMLGDLDSKRTMHRAGTMNVSRTDDFEARLQAAIERLPENAWLPKSSTSKAFEPDIQMAPPESRESATVIKDGKIYRVEQRQLVERKLEGKQRERVVGMMTLRDVGLDALRAIRRGEEAGAKRALLKSTYDAFVKKHGALHQQANARLLADDADAPIILALEKWDAKTKTAKVADLALTPNPAEVKPRTVGDAVALSLFDRGKLDVDYMAERLGQTPEQITNGLAAQGLAFNDPNAGWVTSDEYLSGNVRRKLVQSKAAASADATFERNIEALEKVQPADVEHFDISVKFGAPWVPVEDIKQFLQEALGATSSEGLTVGYLPGTGKWLFSFAKTNAGQRLAQSQTAQTVLATKDASFAEIVQAALQDKPIRIMKRDGLGRDAKEVFDAEASTQANQKVYELKDRFKEWIWDDDARRQRLHRYYNDNFNNVVERKYSGAHYTVDGKAVLPGSNPVIQLRPAQMDGIYRAVTAGKGLFGYEVGVGKTMTMVGAAMELKRLGLATKSIIAVPKKVLPGFVAQAQALYPGANIFTIDDHFTKEKRKQAAAQIATNDYDLVIMTHDHLKRLPVRPEWARSFVQDELSEAEAAYMAAQEESGKGSKGNRIVKELEKHIEKLKTRMAELVDDVERDDAVFFEDLGTDALFIDEFHFYKSLPIYTSLQGVKGIPTAKSQRAMDTLMKMRWIANITGGRNVFGATGTPITNTIAEVYNLQKYFQEDEMQARGVRAFDAWAKTFGDFSHKVEYTASGTYEPVTRFNKFTNLPELLPMSREMMDVVFAEDVAEIERPVRKEQVVTVPMTGQQQMFLMELQARAKAIKEGKVKPWEDNMLAIASDARKSSVDHRLVDPTHNTSETKAGKVVANVMAVLAKAPNATQMIFSDLGVRPGKNSSYSLYADITQMLVRAGIPKEKIINFSELTESQLETAADRLNNGDAIIGIGGSQTMGTGVNAQKYLRALHHVDVPWVPANLEQRDGRGVRQGNTNKEIDIFRYVTEGSFDTFMWQLVDSKSRFIRAFMKGDTGQRAIKESDDETFSEAQIMAIASGDPDLLTKVQLDEDIAAIEQQARAHAKQQTTLRDTKEKLRTDIQTFTRNKAKADADVEALEAAKAADVGWLFNGQAVDKKEARVLRAAEAMRDAEVGKPVVLGSYRGFDLWYTRPISSWQNPQAWLERSEGGLKYEVNAKEDDPASTIASAEAMTRGVALRAKDLAAKLEQANKDLERVTAQIGTPFKQSDELKAKKDELSEVVARMKARSEAKKEPLNAVAEAESEAPAASRRPQMPSRTMTAATNPSDIIANAAMVVKAPTGTRPARAYVNDHAMTVLREAMRAVFNRDYGNASAVTLGQNHIQPLAMYLNKQAAALGDVGANLATLAERLTTLATKYQQRAYAIVDASAMQRNEFGMMDGDTARRRMREDIREEQFHWAQRTISGKSIAMVGEDWAKKKLPKKFRQPLIDLGYPNDRELLTAEFAAHVAAGSFEALGIRTEAEQAKAYEWLAQYFARVAEVHGAEALNQFRHLPSAAAMAKQQGREVYEQRLSEQAGGGARQAIRAGKTNRSAGGSGGGIQPELGAENLLSEDEKEAWARRPIPTAGVAERQNPLGDARLPAPNDDNAPINRKTLMGEQVGLPKATDWMADEPFMPFDGNSLNGEQQTLPKEPTKFSDDPVTPVDGKTLEGKQSALPAITPYESRLRLNSKEWAAEVAERIEAASRGVSIEWLREAKKNGEKSAVKKLGEKGERGTVMRLPYARAVAIAERVGADTSRYKAKQDAWRERLNASVQNGIAASAALDRAAAGSKEATEAKRELDKARRAVLDDLSRLKLTSGWRYPGSVARASLLAALHIPMKNVVEGVASAATNEASKLLRPAFSKAWSAKWGIDYNEPGFDWRGLATASTLGARLAVADIRNAFSTHTSQVDMDVELAEQIIENERTTAEDRKPMSLIGGADKYELGGRIRLVSGFDHAIQFVSDIQRAADAPVRSWVFARSLVAQARHIADRQGKAEGWDDARIEKQFEGLVNDPSPLMVMIAGNEANNVIHNESTALVEWYQDGRAKLDKALAGRMLGALLDQAIRFTRVPVAAARAALWDYAPWGLVNVGWDARKAAQVYRSTGVAVNPEDAARMIRRMGQGATGTAFYLVLGTLISAGLLKVLEDREKEPGKANVQELLGQEEGAMQVGGKQFRGKVFGPLGQGASVAGRVAEATKRREGDGAGSRAKRVGDSVVNAVTDAIPMADAAKDLTEAILRGNATNVAKSFVRPYLTFGPLKEAAQVSDPVRRDTSADGTFRGWMKDEAKAGVPGLRSKLPASRNAFGRKQAQPNPFNVIGLKDVVKDDKAQMLKDANVGAQRPKRKDGELSEDYQKRVQSKGKDNRIAVGDFMKDKLTQSLPMATKRPLLKYEMSSGGQDRYNALSEPARQTDREKRLVVEEGLQQLEANPVFKAMAPAKKEETRKMFTGLFKKFGARKASAKSGERLAVVPPADWVKKAIDAVVGQ
jgi:N12 class adenine-specific DNA methylase/adenine-specific DNA methylase